MENETINLSATCSCLLIATVKQSDVNFFLEVLKELLRFFPSLVMTTDITNSTALHTAAAQGHTDVVKLLLETDSNLAKIARNNGKSVLHTAARMGHLEVVKALLDKDPSIGFKTDRKGQTALHMAIKGQNVEIVTELIKPDPSLLSVEDNKGNTALHIATKKGRNQVGLEASFSCSMILLLFGSKTNLDIWYGMICRWCNVYYPWRGLM